MGKHAITVSRSIFISNGLRVVAANLLSTNETDPKFLGIFFQGFDLNSAEIFFFLEVEVPDCLRLFG